MSLTRWLVVLGVFVGFGCLQVTQRNLLLVMGYTVGAQTRQVHTQETDLAWQTMQVMKLSSPTSLSNVAQARHLRFVAWSTIKPDAASSDQLKRVASALGETSD